MQKFRWWLHNLWIDNCEEKNLYKDGSRYSFHEYWRKYRSWLLAEYRKQCKLEKERNEVRERFKKWT